MIDWSDSIPQSVSCLSDLYVTVRQQRVGVTDIAKQQDEKLLEMLANLDRAKTEYQREIRRQSSQGSLSTT